MATLDTFYFEWNTLEQMIINRRRNVNSPLLGLDLLSSLKPRREQGNKDDFQLFSLIAGQVHSVQAEIREVSGFSNVQKEMW